MLTISLNNLHFFSKHGLYLEEQKIGGEFIVNLSVSYIPAETIIHSIEQTINYVTLYEMIKARMDKPTALLETITMEISNDIQLAFPQVKKISISIQKSNPPIPGFVGSTRVSFEKEI